MKTGAVILAGGYSSRMNDFKPLMQLGGRNLVEHVIRVFRTAGVVKIVVVTGHRTEEVAAEASRLEVNPVYNIDYDAGMYSSVLAGVREMIDMDAFFLIPVDIPLIRPSTLTTLLDHYSSETVVYPTFWGDRGHPPLIPSQLIPLIMDFNGEGGLKALLEKHPGKDVAVWDEGILQDADTADDFARLEHRYSLMETGSENEIKALAELTMDPEIVAHGIATAQVARHLGEALNEKGYSFDLQLLYNAALIHDIAKGQPQHEERGAELVKSLGLSRLVESIGAHKCAHFPDDGILTEKELVCLADKLVCGTKCRPVSRRFEAKLQLYKDDKEACKAIYRRHTNVKDLEEAVVKILGCSLEELFNMEPHG